MIKELMSFAKCEIGKCLVNYFKVIHCSRHVLWQYWLHIFVYYITRRISSREKEEQIIDHLYLISIATLKYIRGMQMNSSTSTSRRATNVRLWKIWRDMWIMMVVEEWLTRTWLWWIMHRRSASERCGIKVPYVMEKGKWIFESEVSIKSWRVT
jgi:hypothetical protein